MQIIRIPEVECDNRAEYFSDNFRGAESHFMKSRYF